MSDFLAITKKCHYKHSNICLWDYVYIYISISEGIDLGVEFLGHNYVYDQL